MQQKRAEYVYALALAALDDFGEVAPVEMLRGDDNVARTVRCIINSIEHASSDHISVLGAMAWEKLIEPLRSKTGVSPKVDKTLFGRPGFPENSSIAESEGKHGTTNN